jgi:hypothetical protein
MESFRGQDQLGEWKVTGKYLCGRTWGRKKDFFCHSFIGILPMLYIHDNNDHFILLNEIKKAVVSNPEAIIF